MIVLLLSPGDRELGIPSEVVWGNGSWFGIVVWGAEGGDIGVLCTVMIQ